MSDEQNINQQQAVNNNSNSNDSSAIKFTRLIKPLSRCIILIVILTTSTGLPIQRLISLALKDLIVFIVGLLWLLGDIIPCMCLFILIHDLLFIVNANIGIVFRERNIRHRDIITTLFIILYIVDLVLSLTCHLNLIGRFNGYDCVDILSSYRIFFFEVQIFISITYTITKVFKNWPNILESFKTFQRSTIDLSNFLQSTNAATAIDQIHGSSYENNRVYKETNHCQPMANKCDTKVDATLDKNSIVPLENLNESNNTRKETSQQASLSFMTSSKRVLKTRPTIKRTLRKRNILKSVKNSSRSSFGRRQTIITYTNRGRASTRANGIRSSSVTLKRINTNKSEGSRTINLNLNMN